MARKRASTSKDASTLDLFVAAGRFAAGMVLRPYLVSDWAEQKDAAVTALILKRQIAKARCLIRVSMGYPLLIPLKKTECGSQGLGC
ncbi:MAG TPA: hypothetical protein DC054_04825 [Blastocatellia bacterium]|nr:hypothetical protein [Blastocatellia bacterium]